MSFIDDIFLPLNNAFAVVFAPLNIFPPIISLLLISSFLTILVIVITKFFVNTKLLKEIKDEMEKIREQLTAAQKEGNHELANDHLKKMMEVNSKYMKHSFKAVIISIIVLGLFLPYLKFKYEGITIAQLPFTIPFIGNSLSWLYWYIVVSFMIGWVVRKVIGMDYA
jgi:uncharacterized membrane protein (DUF106 family)